MTDKWQGNRRQFLLNGVAFAGSAIWLSGCGGGNDNAGTQSLAVRGVLGSDPVSIPRVYPNLGAVLIEANPAKTQLNVTLKTSNLTGVGSVNLRVNNARLANPIFFDFSLPTLEALPNTYTTTLTAADFRAVPEAGINTFADAVNLILSGGAYLSLRSTEFIDIRGPLGQISLSGTLIGAGSASATISATVNALQSAVTLKFQQIGLSDLTSVGLQFSEARSITSEGSRFYTITKDDFGSDRTVTLTATNFMPQPTLSLTTFDDFLHVLLRGLVFVVFDTPTMPFGALSGGLSSYNLQSFLTRDGSPVSSLGNVIINPALGTVTATLQTSNIELNIAVSIPATSLTDITGITLNEGESGTSGVLATLYSRSTDGAYNNTITRKIDEAILQTSPAHTDFYNFRRLLGVSQVYVNVTTTSNPISAARAQLYLDSGIALPPALPVRST